MPMIKIIEIRTLINSYLKTKHPRVYFEVAPDDAEFPYLVFDLPNSNDDGSMEQFVLDVDGWDYPKNANTIPLETLMSVVDGDGDKANPSGLHRKSMVIPGLSLTFYRENRIPLRDDDPAIRRRKHVYQIRTHVGG